MAIREHGARFHSTTWLATSWPAIALIVGGCIGQIDEAPAPAPAPAKVADPRRWSLKSPARAVAPAVKQRAWVKQPIDGFILAGIEAAGLVPRPEADRRTLIRRLSLDVRGLPATAAEIDRFLADPAVDAYDRLVDDFLTDQAYGEHRAHYWLDVARYADTHGFEYDNFRTIWPYRDYVVRAFNANMRFDQFTVEQLAGDLLPDPTLDQRVATGFGRCAMSTGEGGTIEDEFAAIAAKDRVETVAAAWMGLTFGCATCHDHKFDPITQNEFYRMTAFFRNTTQPVFDGNAASPPPVVRIGPETPSLVTEEQPSAPFAYVLKRGRYDQKGERVTPGVPVALPVLPPGQPANRLGLARWLVAPNHPLMARVVVNRFWAEVFGIGIVATSDDFGLAGDAPTNQPLLDWLAVEFRESGFDVKHLFKVMLTSATYRQSAVHTPEGDAADPENRLLWHGPRFRMDAEVIRDQALAAAGLLVRTMGEPPVKPYQPAGLWEAVACDGSTTAQYTEDTGEALFRRSLYTFWKRASPPASLELFNAPTREATVTRRGRTNTPLQALAIMNDPQLLEAARHLAVSALQKARPDTNSRLDYMAVRLLARPLDDTERGVLAGSLKTLLAYYTTKPADAETVLKVGATAVDATIAAPTQAAWMLVAGALLGLDEAVMK